MLKQLKDSKEEMVDNFFELTEAIDYFLEEPLVRNKKEVIEKVRKFNRNKNTLIQRIKDYWCKYE